MTLAKRFFSVIAAFALSIGCATASATTISGNFNQHGYDVVTINVASPSNVNILFTGGYGDPIIGLFNSSGGHLITNDDSVGLYSHITQTLAVGSYSILVSYCCNMLSALPAVTFTGTDGFNSGSYWVGGSGTLAGVQSYLDASFLAGGERYQFELTNAAVGTAVPEPQSVALFGAALAALALSRRRRHRG